MDIDSVKAYFPFPDEIAIRDRESAMLYARHMVEQGAGHRCLVMWVDASVTRFPLIKEAHRLSTAAVSYLDFSSRTWRDFITFKVLSYGTSFAFEAEFLAIHEAFYRASRLTEDFDQLFIFSDCQAILKGLKTKSKFTSLSSKDVLNNTLKHANSMYDLGITVKLQWVPAHSNLEGNERVNELAKRYRRIGESILAGKPHYGTSMSEGVTLRLLTGLSDDFYHALSVQVAHQSQKPRRQQEEDTNNQSINKYVTQVRKSNHHD